jgi:hypothetical protein
MLQRECLCLHSELRLCLANFSFLDHLPVSNFLLLLASTTTLGSKPSQLYLLLITYPISIVANPSSSDFVLIFLALFFATRTEIFFVAARPRTCCTLLCYFGFLFRPTTLGSCLIHRRRTYSTKLDTTHLATIHRFDCLRLEARNQLLRLPAQQPRCQNTRTSTKSWVFREQPPRLISRGPTTRSPASIIRTNTAMMRPKRCN